VGDADTIELEEVNYKGKEVVCSGLCQWKTFLPKRCSQTLHINKGRQFVIL
jgi:hypothetical protein